MSEMRLDKFSLGQSVQLHSPAGGHVQDGAEALHGWLGILLCGVRGRDLVCWFRVSLLTSNHK